MIRQRAGFLSTLKFELINRIISVSRIFFPVARLRYTKALEECNRWRAGLSKVEVLPRMYYRRKRVENVNKGGTTIMDHENLS